MRGVQGERGEQGSRGLADRVSSRTGHLSPCFMYMIMNIFLSRCCTFQVERFILILNQAPREPCFPGRIKIDRCADSRGGGESSGAGAGVGGRPAGLRAALSRRQSQSQAPHSGPTQRSAECRSAA